MDDRPIDEVYDTMRDVEQNPMGAWQDIQQLVAEVARLRSYLDDQADTVARLREALEHSKTGWENIIELELLDPAYDFTASDLLYEARAALEYKD